MHGAGVLQRISDVARASRSELGLMVLLGLAVVGAGLVVVLRSSDAPAPPVERIAVAEQPEMSLPSQSPAEVAELAVHVTGAVAVSGVYSLPEGSRVQDAVTAAGGPLAESDVNALNLAAVLVDGQKVTVPRPGEQIPEDSGIAGEAANSGGKVNLNTASASQLESLPGIGPVLAERIVSHRQSRGRFTSPRQLMEVSGFGPKKYESLKDLISV